MDRKAKITRWPLPLYERLAATAQAEGVTVERVIHLGVQQYVERSEARRGVGVQP